MVNTQKLDKMMDNLGFPDHLIGTEYIRLAVSMYDRSLSMTKEIYPAIAAAAGSSPARVERAIRHAIASAWDRSDWEDQYEYFGHTVHPNRGAPTNMEFFARAARVCRDD